MTDSTPPAETKPAIEVLQYSPQLYDSPAPEGYYWFALPSKSGGFGDVLSLFEPAPRMLACNRCGVLVTEPAKHEKSAHSDCPDCLGTGSRIMLKVRQKDQCPTCSGTGREKQP